MTASAMELQLSRRAQRELDRRSLPLIVEVELYFSCLIRKRVYFPSTAHPDARPLVTANDRLRVYFRPVMGQACTIPADGKPTLIAFPLQRGDAFSPRWLRLDFKAGVWQGEYGFV